MSSMANCVLSAQRIWSNLNGPTHFHDAMRNKKRGARYLNIFGCFTVTSILGDGADAFDELDDDNECPDKVMQLA